MRITTILLLSCLLAGYALSHAGVLRGRAINAETGDPIRDVNITIVESGKMTASDHEGYFKLRGVAAGSYRVTASHIAFDHGDTLRVHVPTENLITFRMIPSPWVLSDVVTTGTRTPHVLKNVPVQTEVISQRDFRRTGASTVDEALVSSIGLQIRDGDFSGQTAMIRGIEGDRVLILVDGQRVVGRVRGAIDLAQFSLVNVEKIEVVKGTGSTLYGSDAMGGVINIITKTPTKARRQANLYLDYGTHRSYNPSAEFEYGNREFGLSLGGTHYSTDGFDLDRSTPHTNGQDRVDRWNFNTSIRKKLSSRSSLTAAGRFMHEDRGWIESEVVRKSALEDTTYVYDDHEKNNRYEGSVTFDYLSSGKYSMKARLYATYYTHNWDKYADGFWVDTSNTDDVHYNLSYTSNYVIGQNHVATYGLDFSYQDLRSSELTPDKDSDRSVAGYVQYEYSPVNSLVLLGGVRYERHSSFGGHVNPSFNFMYQPGRQFKLRGYVGHGFRAPSIKEQFFIFDHTAAGYVVYGGSAQLPAQVSDSEEPFTALHQENSINSSLSAEFSYGGIGMHRLTYFYNHLDGLIDFVLVGFTPTYWRGVYVYQNIETAITQGVEWESRVRLSRAVDFSFSYNYLYTRNLSIGQKLLNRPDHTLKVFVTGFHEETGLGGSFWSDYHSPKLWRPRSNTGGNESTEGEPETYAPHRTRLNLNLFKRFENGAEIFLRLENLLNETSLQYGYWPGFQLFAGVKLDVGT